MPSKKKSTSKKVQEAVKASEEVSKSASSHGSKNTKANDTNDQVIRLPAEKKFQEELDALKANDSYPKPPNWALSPHMVEEFIQGSKKSYELNGKKVSISTKFFGHKDVVQKSIVTLASERGLMLVGEPGTGKSWLSELLAAAICGNSTYLIQGTAGTTEDQLRYTWNYALLIANGPSIEALVPSPTINSMKDGRLLRIEELTRCPQEIQDSLISILSEKVIPVPELGKEYQISAKQGFNVIATANDRDRGVNEMSAALKRRFNFIYIPVMNDKKLEKAIVQNRVEDMMEKLHFKVQIPDEIYEIATASFQELRKGSADGKQFKQVSSVMSVSEEISLLFDSAIYAHFFGKDDLGPEFIAMNLCEAVIKDNKENWNNLNEYLNLIVKPRAGKDPFWKRYYDEFDKELKHHKE